MSVIKSAAASSIVRQSAGYIASALVINAMALVTTVVLTHILSVESYSQYAFVLNLLIFSSLFFELGMFYPAAQLIAKSAGTEARALTGAAVILWLGASGIFTVTVLAATLGPVQAIFKLDVAGELRAIAPFAGAWLATQLSLLVAQGHGRVHVYSVTNAGSSALLLVSALGALQAGSHNNVILMLTIYGATSLAGSLACLTWLKPTLHGWSRASRSILTQTRAWGFDLYVGRVLSMATYRLDVLMLGALAGGSSVATYVLATALTAPIGLPGIAVATALFQRMASSTRIDPKWLVLPLAASLIGILVLGLIGGSVVNLLFSAEYAGISTLLSPLSLAAVLQGTTMLYNKFLTSHEAGKELRTAAIWLSVSNIVFNVILIPPYAALGAAWASVFALAVNLIAHLFCYRKLVKVL